MEIKIEDYEKYLTKLSTIVERLDDSSTSLDESLKLYSQGLEIYEGLKSVLENEKAQLFKFDGKDFVED